VCGWEGLGLAGVRAHPAGASEADPTNDQHWHLMSGLRTAPHLRRLTLQIHEVCGNRHDHSVEHGSFTGRHTSAL
jgi:hypothetical protein